MACTAVGKRQVLTVGGLEFKDPGKDDAPMGLLMYDMTAMRWKDSYDATLSDYERPGVISAFYKNGSLVKVQWSSNEVQSLFVTGSGGGSQGVGGSDNGTSGMEDNAFLYNQAAQLTCHPHRPAPSRKFLGQHIKKHHRRRRRRRPLGCDCPRSRRVVHSPSPSPPSTKERRDRVFRPRAARHRRDGGGAGSDVLGRPPERAPAGLSRTWTKVRPWYGGRRGRYVCLCRGGWHEPVLGAPWRSDGQEKPGGGAGWGCCPAEVAVIVGREDCKRACINIHY